MKKIVVCTIIVFQAIAGNAQQKGIPEQPDKQIFVNKKYDENGNLIQFDSTYVHKWSVDTTLNFGFPTDSVFPYYSFPDIERFMNKFWNDSTLGHPVFPHQPFSFGFRFSPFEDDEDFQNKNPQFPDSLFQPNFPYHFDSLFFNFGKSPFGEMHPWYNPEYFENLENHLEKQFKDFHHHRSFPDFNNKQQLEEWKKLKKKHQKEIEELRKKWKKSDKN